MPDLEVILQQDVEPLGRMGDVVKVSPGYARNYLLPRRIAVRAEPESLKRVAKLKAKRAAVEVKLVEEATALAGRIAAMEIAIEATTTETGQLYGSVGAREILAALAKEGIALSERDVRLAHPVKELGVFPVKIHLRGDVSAELKVSVVEAKKSQ
jgi:large subunit ribosomal protein L9